MPGGGRRVSIIFTALITGAVVCGAVVLLLVGTVSLPGALQSLGPPAPGLDPLQRSALGGYLLLQRAALDGPAGEPGATIDLVVEEGENAGSVVSRLTEAGVVAQGTLLRVYLRYRGLDVGIQAGGYLLSGDMSIRQIAEALQTSRPNQFVVTIPEGWRREQIGELLETSGVGVDAEAFLLATETHPTGYFFSGELASAPSLEGYLFPDTYLLEADTTAEELVLEMLDNFERRVDLRVLQGFNAQGLALNEAVTLASIVEREAVVPMERPRIASVFLNRLRLGMKLDADPTVQYALGRQPGGGWWKAPLSLDDLRVDSAYNTYLYPDLPPGPISNPGLASLEAVAFPEQTDFLYFRVACDGSGRHEFSRTYEEHVGKACP